MDIYEDDVQAIQNEMAQQFEIWRDVFKKLSQGQVEPRALACCKTKLDEAQLWFNEAVRLKLEAERKDKANVAL